MGSLRGAVCRKSVKMAPHCSRLPWMAPKKQPARMCWARDALETPEVPSALGIEKPHRGGCVHSRRAAKAVVSVRPQLSRGEKVGFGRDVDETNVDVDSPFGSGFVAGGQPSTSGRKQSVRGEHTRVYG